MVDFTNSNFRSNQRHVDIAEIDQFMGVLLAMCVNPAVYIDEYWSQRIMVLNQLRGLRKRLCNISTCKHTQQLYKYSIYNTIRGMAKSRREGVTVRASIVQLSNSGLPTASYLQFQRLKESASRAC